MSFTAWLTAAGTFGLLAALVAWLIYRAGRKDVETERLKDNEQARKESDKAMDDVKRTSDADLDKRLRDL